MEKTPKTLNWRFDVSTFKLLGRELITDRITAVFEVVKNCYDANAENVIAEEDGTFAADVWQWGVYKGKIFHATTVDLLAQKCHCLDLAAI